MDIYGQGALKCKDLADNTNSTRNDSSKEPFDHMTMECRLLFTIASGEKFCAVMPVYAPTTGVDYDADDEPQTCLSPQCPSCLLVSQNCIVPWAHC
jgi:hypothetical protein